MFVSVCMSIFDTLWQPLQYTSHRSTLREGTDPHQNENLDKNLLAAWNRKSHNAYEFFCTWLEMLDGNGKSLDLSLEVDDGTVALQLVLVQL